MFMEAHRDLPSNRSIKFSAPDSQFIEKCFKGAHFQNMLSVLFFFFAILLLFQFHQFNKIRHTQRNISTYFLNQKQTYQAFNLF